jgi:hypothetical protein
MPTPSQLIRSLCGIVIGYIVFVAGAWVAQEAILGGVSYYDTLPIIALAGIFTPLSAVLGAWVTAAIAKTRPFRHIVPMCILIAVETTYLYRTGKVDGPLWFEALAGASLIIGAIIGAVSWRWWFPRQDAKSAIG